MRLAQAAEIDNIANHYTEAATYANTVGHIDWEIPFPAEVVAEYIENEELFCVDGGNGELEASVKLTVTPDIRIWSDLDIARFLYVSKLATASAVHRTDFTSVRLLPQIKDFAKHTCCYGIRLDCLANNPRLRHFYEKIGFVSVGDATFDSRKQGVPLTVTRFEMLI